SRGLHLAFTRLDPTLLGAVHAKLEAIREENREPVERAIAAAAEVSAAFEEAVSSKQITFEDLFDNNYIPIEGTNPVQYRTRFLDLMEKILPPLLYPRTESDARTVLCVAIDRNGQARWSGTWSIVATGASIMIPNGSRQPVTRALTSSSNIRANMKVRISGCSRSRPRCASSASIGVRCACPMSSSDDPRYHVPSW